MMPALARMSRKGCALKSSLATPVLLATVVSAAAPDELALPETAAARIAALRQDARYGEALRLSRADLSRLRAPVNPAPSWKVADAVGRVAVLEAILDLDGAARRRVEEADGLAREQNELARTCRYVDALAVAERRLGIYREVLAPYPSEIVPLLTEMASIVFDVDEFPRAEAWLAEALELGRETRGPEHPWIANALSGLARIRIEQGEHAAAIDLLEEALEMRRSLYGPKHRTLVDDLQQLAEARSRHRLLNEAEVAALEALEMGRSILGDAHPGTARAASVLGGLRSLQGRYAEAERLISQALDVIREQPATCGLSIVPTLWDLASVYFRQGDYEEAREIVLEIRSAYDREMGSQGSYVDVLHNLGVLSHYLGEDEEAVRYFQRAVRRKTELFGENFEGTLASQANLARSLTSLGRYDEAQTILEHAIEVLSAAKEPGAQSMGRNHAIAIRFLVNLLDRKGEYDRAESYARILLERARKNVGEGHEDTLSMLRSIGEARFGKGDLEGAIRWFESAARSYEEGRVKAGTGTRAATFHETPYENLVLARLEANQGDDAWHDLERARGRLLADVLIPADAVPWPLEKVQASLPGTAAIIGWIDHELRWNEPRSWGYVVRRKGPVRWVRLDPAVASGGEGGELGEYRGALAEASSSPFPPALTELLEARARRLWSARVEPLLPHLEGVKEIVVVPSGAMEGIPLESLMNGEGRYFGDAFALSYAVSSTIHAWLAGRPPENHQIRRALLVGDPVFGGPSTDQQGAKLRGAGEKILRGVLQGDPASLARLPRLEASGEEVRGVAGLVPGSTILLRDKATESALMELAGSGEISRYDVVHLATHALVDNRKPARSALVMAQAGPADGDGPEPDGLVTSEEIAEGWKLNAELVTLSACETAVGRKIFGEGIVGFAYPFLQAGARSLLVSLWKVDDRATALLMGRFYEEWLGSSPDDTPREARRSKAEALQAAKRWLREYRGASGGRPYEHPAYWGAFVLIGDGS